MSTPPDLGPLPEPGRLMSEPPSFYEDEWNRHQFYTAAQLEDERQRCYMLGVAAASQWRPYSTMPSDGGSYLVADAERGFVAPYTRGLIHNNPGTPHDWQYGEAITHWMPLPAAPSEPTKEGG